MQIARTLSKFILPCLLISGLIVGCQGGGEVSLPKPSYLDSLFTVKFCRYDLDRLEEGKELAPADLKFLRRFLSHWGDSIQGQPSYRSLLASAKAAQAMDTSVSGHVTSISYQIVRTAFQIRMTLSFENKLSKALGQFTGRVHWLDQQGHRIHTSPSFVVADHISAGGKVDGLRLEYGPYRPTNPVELKDPGEAERRDTFDLMQAMIERQDMSAFQVEIDDIRLANGLPPAQYCLLPDSVRAKLLDKPQLPLSELKTHVQWAEDHADLLERMKNGGMHFMLVTTPVLTTRSEGSHGVQLFYDREISAQRYFWDDLRINSDYLSWEMPSNGLLMQDLVNCNGWPCDFRIYRKWRRESM